MLPGDVIDGRYTLERQAGAGGMGTVFRARDGVTGETVALKILHEHTALDEGRFQREAAALAHLEHPAIVRYIAHGKTAAGRLYLAMEWLDGVTLADRLESASISIRESVAVAHAVAGALSVAHRAGIVHRDVKPQNVQIASSGVAQIKLLDFGIARPLMPDWSLTKTGAILGTPGYMAPEQARGDREIGPRADVFALGCLLYACLTGGPPFRGTSILGILAKTIVEEPPRAAFLCVDVPPSLDELVGRMLAKDPGQRPANGGEAAAALELLADMPHGPRSRQGIEEALTAVEQRFVSVVLVRNIPTSFDGEARAKIVGAIQQRGGKVEVLPDGSILVAPTTTSDLKEQATQAARFGLLLRASLPEAQVALATARTLIGGRVPIGNTVDRAIDALAHVAPGKTTLDALTASVLGESFVVSRSGEVLYLEAENDDVNVARTVAGHATTFLGRDRELAMLEAIIDESIDEPVARVAIVTAAAGGGKSRLRRELLLRLAERRSGMTVLFAQGNALAKGSPFGLLAETVRRETRILDRDPPEVRREKLVMRLGRHVAPSALDRVAAFLGELVHASVPDDRAGELAAVRNDPLLLGDGIRGAWQDWLAAECAAGPVLVAFEDLHWGDRPSVDVVDSALRSMSRRPLTVLAFARPEVSAEFPSLWSERVPLEVRLSALTRKASEKLVREVLGAAVDPLKVTQIVDRADGNPFYLEEMIRSLAEGSDSAVPGTVISTVQARLDALGPDIKRVLRAASVFGATFWRRGALALLGREVSEDGIVACLSVLVAKELVIRKNESAGDAEYAFCHDLVRDAAYQLLSDADRELGHRLAGAWLEENRLAEPIVLAEHFERGAARERAANWYVLATEQAQEGNDLVATVARAEQAIACGTSGDALGDMHLARAAAYNWRADHVRGEACARAAMDGLPRHGVKWFRAAIELTTALVRTALPRAVEWTAELLQVSPEKEASGAYVYCLARCAILVIRFGRIDLAGSLVHRVIDLVGDESHLAPSAANAFHGVTSLIARASGDAEKSVTHQRAGIAASEQAYDLRLASLGRISLGGALVELGMREEPVTVLEDALRVAQRIGATQIVTIAQLVLGTIHFDLGDVARARASLEIALELSRQDPALGGAARLSLSRCAIAAGDPEHAEQQTSALLVFMPNMPRERAIAHSTRALARIALGRAKDAVEDAAQAVAMFPPSQSFAFGESYVRIVHVEALEASGDRAAAAPALSTAVARIRARSARLGSFRESFLRVPENARALDLARAWGIGQDE